MELTQDDTIPKIDKQCKHCKLNTLLPYEYEWTCIASCSNIIQKKICWKKFNEKNYQQTKRC